MFTSRNPDGHYAPRATKEGVVLYGFNKAHWEDIVAAKKISFIGLPYLILKLNERLPPYYFRYWWVPLYVGQLSNFFDGIKAHSPVKHPLRSALHKTERLSFAELCEAFVTIIISLGVIFVGTSWFFSKL